MDKSDAPTILLTPEEAMKATRLSRAKLWQLIMSGEIKSIKIGRSRRIPLKELEAWIASELERQNA